MQVYIVEYNGKTIGVWDSFNLANEFILGCQQSSLMISSANIKTFKMNSCFCNESNTIEQTNVVKMPKKTSFAINDVIGNSIESVKKPIKQKQKIDENDPTFIKISNKKIELQHNINMLKQQKKRIEESKSTYENDLKLFELFTNSKIKDANFVIPEIFIKKFELMTKLKNENDLSWDSFVNEFKHENHYNEHFGLNDYENAFLNSDNDSVDNNTDSDNNNDDIDEEMNIETESDTDTSTDEN
jgi:hypothetical protein